MRRALVLVLLWLWVLPVAPAQADTGPWGWPLSGPHQVARPFAPPASAYGSGHRGADLPSTAGAPVRASAAGRVTYAGLLAGRGVVVVTHGSLRTTYEPVTASVAVGAVVAPGEVVGRLDAGHLGCPVAACLHWGLRRGEEYLDPVRLVQRGPVRLLPVDGVGGGPYGALSSGVPAAGGVSAGGVSADGVAAGGVAAGGVAAGAEDVSPHAPGSSRAELRPRPAPAHEPSWSLRADEAPLGAAAVAALVVGIGLLARPRPQAPRPGPPAAPLAAGAPPPGATSSTAAAAVAGASLPVPAPALPSPAAASSGGSPATPPPVAPAGPTAAAACVLDLSAERARRRPA